MKQTLRVALVLIVCAGSLTGAGWAADDKWSVELTPYIWAVNIDGNATFGGQRADFHVGFSDIIKNVNLGGELLGVATYKRFVGIGQVDYISLNQDFENGPGGELDANSLFLTVGAGYRFKSFAKGSTLTVGGGVRYLRMDSDLKVNGIGTLEKTTNLADAILIVRSAIPLNGMSGKLSLNLAASIGAGDSDLVWELQPAVQYQFSERLAGRVGYRRLQYEFEDNGVDLDMGFEGLFVGLGITL